MSDGVNNLLSAIARSTGLIRQLPPPPQRRHTIYGFPMADVRPQQTRVLKIKLDTVFRAERLMMVGFMDEIRGHFKIKHTRLPLLNRENVIAYSNVTRVKSRRRTTVEYRENKTGNFVRTYLPENVVYVHTDPLSYITLKNVLIGEEKQMPSFGDGPPAVLFSSTAIGNGVMWGTSRQQAISVKVKNVGDIRVRVFASIAGIELVQP